MLNKEINRQNLRAIVTLLVLLLLAIWQYRFVIEALNSNVYLNGTLIGTFLFGVYTVFRNIKSLRNEQVLFEALREEYEDILSESTLKDGTDWRLSRCESPAVVFESRGMLEQAYLLCSDMIRRSGHLTLQSGTLANFIEGIRIRSEEQRSMTIYIAGILILLGLIGTFIGLMQTLNSVGVIIGDVDLSQEANKETIASLLTNLQLPLQGMGVGFSSSLFGLMTSLTLGLMGRFAVRASNTVKVNFEDWLSNLSRIEGSEYPASGNGSNDASIFHTAGGGGSDDGSGLPGIAISRADMRILLRAVRNAVVATCNLKSRTGELAGHISELSQQQTHQQALLARLSENVATAGNNQSAVTSSLNEIARRMSVLEEVKDANSTLGEIVQAHTEQTGNWIIELRQTMENLRESLASFPADDEEEMQDHKRLIGQLDHLLAVNRLSGKEERSLKELAKFMQDYRTPLEALRERLTRDEGRWINDEDEKSSESKFVPSNHSKKVPPS